MKIATVDVKYCEDCPHFYYDYVSLAEYDNEKCMLLNRRINCDIYGIYHIPGDCPLEDKKDKDE